MPSTGPHFGNQGSGPTSRTEGLGDAQKAGSREAEQGELPKAQNRLNPRLGLMPSVVNLLLVCRQGNGRKAGVSLTASPCSLPPFPGKEPSNHVAQPGG